MSEKQGEGAKLYQNYLGEGTVKPANVSITCFMDWLDFINESYQKEYLLKKQILLNINYTIPSAKLQKLSQIWTSHSNIPLKEGSKDVLATMSFYTVIFFFTHVFSD
eukprot:TRINITY_DN4153_c0_g1_i1.p1 TRINITY_DN4153_c0_g1~~TRINITY_DN4153_c0_g1_i1.p1  ORF type:complete len:107 (+),score=15.39 TRINITY_DN4153_c0_g1_i1:373-693(+)